jgi:hypothetical protein
VVQRRSVPLIRATLEGLEAEAVRNPGGWLRCALEGTWFASTPPPGRRRRAGSASGAVPLARHVEALAAGDRSAWVPEEPPRPPSRPDASRPDASRPPAGHREALALLDALGLQPSAVRPLSHWWRIDGPRRYPRRRLAVAAARLVDHSPRAAEAARRVLALCPPNYTTPPESALDDGGRIGDDGRELPNPPHRR